MSFVYYLLALLFGFVCVFLILLILIQKGRGGGLSGAFGGAGGNTAFGTKTGDILTWITAGVFLGFLLLSCGLIWTTNYLHGNATMIGSPAPLDDTFDGQTAGPLDADGDGQIEINPPGESSLPDAPTTPEPGIRPDADGTTGEGQGTPPQPTTGPTGGGSGR